MGAGGAFYVQVFQYIDPDIAFGVDKSVEMLLVERSSAASARIWGPVLGAVVLHALAEVTRNLFGERCPA